MHVQTFTTINSLTSSYVAGLISLRNSLNIQLAQVEAQIEACEAFATEGDMPTKPGEPVTPAPEYRDPKFLKSWKDDMSGTLQTGAPGPGAITSGAPVLGAITSGEVKRNAEGRPILSDEDMKRLETAVAGA